MLYYPAYDPDPANRIEADVAATAADRAVRSLSGDGEDRTLDTLIAGGFSVTLVGFRDKTSQHGEPHYSVILDMSDLPSPSKVTLHGTGSSLDDAVRDAMSIGERLYAVAMQLANSPLASRCRAPVIHVVVPEPRR